MHTSNRGLFLLAHIFIVYSSKAQTTDTTKISFNATDTTTHTVNWSTIKQQHRFPLTSMLVSGMAITYGIASTHNEELKELNTGAREEIYTEHPHNKFHLDNFLQFAPAGLVYGLNAAGIKGRHNFKDRSSIYLLSNIILNTTIFSTKKLSHQLRPDQSGFSSFPSGHTAEAFASAEFLRLEYKDVSPWYGVAGYAMALSTGYLRMYNNKHWFSDVIAGAGVGIVSTHAAYWLYSKFQQKHVGNKYGNTIALPTYQNGSFGLELMHKF